MSADLYAWWTAFAAVWHVIAFLLAFGLLSVYLVYASTGEHDYPRRNLDDPMGEYREVQR